jgi:hypothetical protein
LRSRKVSDADAREPIRVATSAIPRLDQALPRQRSLPSPARSPVVHRAVFSIKSVFNNKPVRAGATVSGPV